jgi:dTDP-4-dehydrorhamnose 3,5-epimerase
VRFVPTAVDGVVIVELEPIEDERGFFARAWCPDEFADAGIATTWVQENIAYNTRRRTLRGLHFQSAPHAEVKLVRCTRGQVWDVAVDLRPDSPTFRQSVGVELSAENHRSLYIPEGYAHGYLTLSDGVEMRYLTSHPYVPEASTGVPYADPFLAVEWPGEPEILSEKDRTWPPLTGADDVRLGRPEQSGRAA